jgi:medium-chain acyl-[acyl-carrier-protein] hydrolase
MPDNPPPIHIETFTIHPIECDFNQEWKPSAIVQHLTDIAGIHATELGVGFDFMLAHNLFWVHSRMKVVYYTCPRANQVVMIRTWPTTIRRRLVYLRDFEILDERGDRMMAASSAWVIIDASTRRLAPPEAFNLTIPEVHIATGMDGRLEHIDQARDGEERLRVRAGYSTVDLVGHVNNSRYVEWTCDAFPIEMFQQNLLDYLQINYEHEVLPGEEVSILVNQVRGDGKLWAVEGRNLSNGSCAFKSLLRWKETEQGALRD